MKRLMFLSMLGLVACGDSELGGAEILPHVSPIQLGKFWPTGNTTPDPGNRERTPYEFVLLLQSKGESELVVDKVCLGDNSSNFEIEGPEPTRINPGDQGAVRITYIRSSTGADRTALVVKSNAANFPDLVIPLCAEVVPDQEPTNLVTPCEISAEESAAALEGC